MENNYEINYIEDPSIERECIGVDASPRKSKSKRGRVYYTKIEDDAIPPALSETEKRVEVINEHTNNKILDEKMEEYKETLDKVKILEDELLILLPKRISVCDTALNEIEKVKLEEENKKRYYEEVLDKIKDKLDKKELELEEKGRTIENYHLEKEKRKGNLKEK